MSENYSIKINRAEGIVEVSGEDKDWVNTKLSELKNIINEPAPIIKKESGSLNPPAGTPKPKTSSRRKGNSSSGRAQKNPELATKLTTEKKDALEKYMQARKTSFHGSLPAQAAIIATFLNDELNWLGVDHNDMYTVYSAMGWRQPGNPRSQLNNALSRNHYFDGVTDSKYMLSHRGENFARHDSKEEE